MAKLMENQLYLAAKAMHERFALENDPIGSNLHVCMRGLECAAPFLQMPWDEPTGEESALFSGQVRNDYASHVGRSLGDACAQALTVFVNRRNASLLPKQTLEERVTVGTKPDEVGWRVFLDGQWKFGGEGISRCDAEIYRLGLIEKMKKDEVK